MKKKYHDVIISDNDTISIGNYTNIIWTGTRNKSGHKIFSAECRTCGARISATMSDLRCRSLKCLHNSHSSNTCKSMVCGVGVNDMPKGWLDQNDYNKRVYYLWKAMLRRTTERFWQKSPSYEGTDVSAEWLCLSIFAKDIEELEGFEIWKSNPGSRIMLDKDTKIAGNKLYSKDTCCFISNEDSNRDVYKRNPNSLDKARLSFAEKHGIPIKAINLTNGEEVTFESMNDASRKLNIPPAHIWMILSSDLKYRSHKSAKSSDKIKWTFQRI